MPCVNCLEGCQTNPRNEHLSARRETEIPVLCRILPTHVAALDTRKKSEVE